MDNGSATIEISDPSKLPANPLVSVYMLAYRHEKFIAEAIEGVLAQKCDFPIELIIGEDCSPDGTGAIVLDYQRRYPQLIRVLTAEQNVGALTNARRCQLATRGKYIAICEGDDYWHHPHKLQMQVDLMSTNPDMVVCHTDFDRLTRFRRWRNKHRNYPSSWLAHGHAYRALLHEWSVVTATSLWDRDVFEKFWGSEFDNPKWPFGDRNRLLFASQLGEFGYIDQSTATFRKVAGSAVNGSNDSYLKMHLAGEECVNLFMKRYPTDPATERVVNARLKSYIYSAAFFTERKDLMQSTHDWLRINGFRPNDTLHSIRIAAVDFRIPVRTLRAIKNFVDLRLSAIQS